MLLYNDPEIASDSMQTFDT